MGTETAHNLYFGVGIFVVLVELLRRLRRPLQHIVDGCQTDCTIFLSPVGGSR
jgi:hypothetical protein